MYRRYRNGSYKLAGNCEIRGEKRIMILSKINIEHASYFRVKVVQMV